MEMVLFIYMSCFIYNNILINANNTDFIMFFEEIFFDNYFNEKDIMGLVIYFCILPLASIIISCLWIKGEIVK